MAGAAPLSACAPLAGREPADARSEESAGELNDLVVATPTIATNQMTPDLTVLGVYRPNAYVFERLTQTDENYQLKPMLAERWELVNNNATWRFHLRRGVTFHDGTPFTARDVIFTFKRTARRRGRPVNATEGSAVAVDRDTDKFTPAVRNLKVPWRMADLGHGNAHIIKAGSDPSVHPMGTGPLKFVGYQADKSLRVERYDGYGTRPTRPASGRCCSG